jgi:hypothetical protein
MKIGRSDIPYLAISNRKYRNFRETPAVMNNIGSLPNARGASDVLQLK